MTVDDFSIQPWARTAGDNGGLTDVLARVNLERGHFRDITEASLQEDLAADGALTLSEIEEDEDAEETDRSREAAHDKPKTREELFKAKYEMLASVNAAQQEILTSLDFVSLLLSKDAPKPGVATISPALKQTIPTGTLGVDMWQKIANDKAREAQDDLLASNIRLKSLEQSADGLLSAATRLQDNVRKETEYWNQVLTISEEGWNVCRIPGQHNKLAVRFGFGESSPEFSRRGMVAINSNADGKVSLERGVGRQPKALHATLRQGSRVVGTSKLPESPDPDSTTLETRIRYARDSLYDEELYHEMIRESRALSSLDITMVGSAIRFDSKRDDGVDLTLSLDLVSLDDEKYGLQYDPTNGEDRLAQATVLAARLLLTQAHRDRLKKRSGIPPPLSDKRKDEKALLPLLRPLIAFFMHQSALRSLNAFLGNVAAVLGVAKVDVVTSPTKMRLPERSGSWDADSLIRVLLESWSSEGVLTIRDSRNQDVSFKITIQTDLQNSNFNTVWNLATSASNSPYRFERVEEFMSTATIMICSVLANASLLMAGENWTCEEHEALLIKDQGVGNEAESMEVMIDMSSRSLALQTLEKKSEWTTDGESSSMGFWETVSGIVASNDN